LDDEEGIHFSTLVFEGNGKLVTAQTRLKTVRRPRLSSALIKLRHAVCPNISASWYSRHSLIHHLPGSILQVVYAHPTEIVAYQPEAKLPGVFSGIFCSAASLCLSWFINSQSTAMASAHADRLEA
jgi:hypothetical protein